MVQSARPLTISASSFASSGRSGAPRTVFASGERKEDLLQRSSGHTGLLTQFFERADPPHLASSQKNEPVANPVRVGELVNGQNERASHQSLVPDHTDDVTRLTKIEAIEWFIHQQ